MTPACRAILHRIINTLCPTFAFLSDIVNSLSSTFAQRALGMLILLLPILLCVPTRGHGQQATPAVTAKQTPAEEFAKHVRTTAPLSPQEELAGFQLPPGFEIQLVAAEPDIAKPMNLAFDLRGRLWVTSSEEYPYPAKDPEQARDTIKVIEDSDGDGRFDKVTTFADRLNIPIGLYPYRDGVICFSIPNILFLRDTDGDRRADVREVLYGPFDTTRDTHGMCNGFTRGFDGWLYACHGFNNQSSVQGRDGHRIEMQSGNTFRMRLDGSRIEHFTHGQVNPFGMAFDHHGDLFTADCHTKPVSLLLRGGHYPSFGKPHDGLGFVPAVMEHLHGSTAIGGIALYQDDAFPTQYYGNTFGGNVMTSRINRNVLRHVGGSVEAVKQADFLISNDPWFRPVDLQVGPDGALYIADFYNRIIGHYEVPLDHPGRDRHRGRIWRIVYRDKTRSITPAETSGIDALVQLLSASNLQLRMQACDALVDQYGRKAVPAVRKLLASPKTIDRESFATRTRVHALWFLHRVGSLTASDLNGAVQHPSTLVRNHAFRILSESDLGDVTNRRGWLSGGLRDESPRVARSAAMATAQHPEVDMTGELLEALARGKADPHLRHAIRIALKQQLSVDGRISQLSDSLSTSEIKELGEICLAVPGQASAQFLIDHLDDLADLPQGRLDELIRFTSRYASPKSIAELIHFGRQLAGTQLGRQESLLRAIEVGFGQRGISVQSTPWQSWATDFVRQSLGVNANDRVAAATHKTLPWTSRSAIGESANETIWTTSRRRRTRNKNEPIVLWSSFPKGEQKTGIYRSAVFPLPKQLQFFLAGHDGFPDKPIGNKNYVRLVHDRSGETLAKWSPPRFDQALRIEWEASEDQVGVPVRIELVDGDDATAYAWLAAGGFSVASLNPSPLVENRRKAARFATEFSLPSTRKWFVELMNRSDHDPVSQSAFARAVLGKQASSTPRALAAVLGQQTLDSQLRSKICQQLSAVGADQPNSERSISLLAEALKQTPSSQQRVFAQQLASDRSGTDALIALVRQGRVSPAVIAEQPVRQLWQSVATPSQAKQLEKMAEGAPETDPAVLTAIAGIKADFAQNLSAKDDLTKDVDGATLFNKHCSACHQLAGKGTAVGPNLDGIGNRGLNRLLEDVCLPNQNVDLAFRSSVILTSDGRVVSGLVQRKEGEQLVLATTEGRIVRLPTAEIEQVKQSELSPMPANFAEVLGQDKLAALMAFLLTLRDK
jgi:putative heme-binding domain-containing protein